MQDFLRAHTQTEIRSLSLSIYTHFLRKYHILLWHIPAPLLFRVREATDALLKFMN